MHDTLRNPSTHQRERAQREIQIMTLLKDGPLTVIEIAEQMNMNARTIKCIMQDLKAAKVVAPVNGSRKLHLPPIQNEVIQMNMIEKSGTG